MTAKRLTCILLAALLMLAVLPLFPVPANAASGDVEISAANFPDDAFRDYVLNTVNNGNTVLTASTISKQTTIDVGNLGITDLTGIGYFTELKTLFCHNNGLASLDLRGCAKLETLSCGDNHLVSLDLSGNPSLLFLYCDNNQLPALDTSHNTALIALHCANNALTALNTGCNTSLRELKCGYNPFTSLDLWNNTALQTLSCINSGLESLDVSGRSDLRYLELRDNHSLISLDCSGCRLESLIIFNCDSLQALDCSGNPLPATRIESVELVKAYYQGTKGENDTSIWWTGPETQTLKLAKSTSLSIYLPYPTFTKQPKKQTVEAKTDAVFTLQAKNAINYQWEYSKDDGDTWIECHSDGSDTDTFSFQAAVSMDGRLYRCRVDNYYRESISRSVRLYVVKITEQPAAQTVDPGEQVTFEVSASGSPTYQWQYSKDNGKTWTDCSSTGNKNAVFSFRAKASMNGRLYRCVVTRDTVSITSRAVKLTVNTAEPSITTQPANKTVTAGNTVKFTVTAAGDGLTYQWQYSKDNGSTWTDCKSTGHDTAAFSFTATASMNGRLYRCKVSNPGGTVTSSAAKLTVKAGKPVITAQPVNKTVTAGSTAKFTVTATGTDLTYQWQYSKDNGQTWINCTSSGYNKASFSFTAKASMTGRLYRCKVTNSYGSVTSSTAKLTVK